jgi:hypothetical protein
MNKNKKLGLLALLFCVTEIVFCILVAHADPLPGDSTSVRKRVEEFEKNQESTGIRVEERDRPVRSSNFNRLREKFEGTSSIKNTTKEQLPLAESLDGEKDPEGKGKEKESDQAPNRKRLEKTLPVKNFGKMRGNDKGLDRKPLEKTPAVQNLKLLSEEKGKEKEKVEDQRSNRKRLEKTTAVKDFGKMLPEHVRESERAYYLDFQEACKARNGRFKWSPYPLREDDENDLKIQQREDLQGKKWIYCFCGNDDTAPNIDPFENKCEGSKATQKARRKEEKISQRELRKAYQEREKKLTCGRDQYYDFNEKKCRLFEVIGATSSESERFNAIVQHHKEMSLGFKLISPCQTCALLSKPGDIVFDRFPDDAPGFAGKAERKIRGEFRHTELVTDIDLKFDKQFAGFSSKGYFPGSDSRSTLVNSRSKFLYHDTQSKNDFFTNDQNVSPNNVLDSYCGGGKFKENKDKAWDKLKMWEKGLYNFSVRRVYDPERKLLNEFALEKSAQSRYRGAGVCSSYVAWSYDWLIDSFSGIVFPSPKELASDKQTRVVCSIKDGKLEFPTELDLASIVKNALKWSGSPVEVVANHGKNILKFLEQAEYIVEEKAGPDDTSKKYKLNYNILELSQ